MSPVQGCHWRSKSLPEPGEPDDDEATKKLFLESEGDNGPPLEGNGGNVVPPPAEEAVILENTGDHNAQSSSQYLLSPRLLRSLCRPS